MQILNDQEASEQQKLKNTDRKNNYRKTDRKRKKNN